MLGIKIGGGCMKFNPLKIQKEVNESCSFDEVNISATDSKKQVLDKLRYYQKFIEDNADCDIARVNNLIQKYGLEE